MWGFGDLKQKVGLNEIPYMIFTSPGLMRALEESRLIASNMPLDEKLKELKSHISQLHFNRPFVSVEEIIQKILQNRYEISDEELERFKKFARNQSALMPGGLPTSKMAAVEALQRDEEIAKSAFKAITDHALLKAMGVYFGIIC